MDAKKQACFRPLLFTLPVLIMTAFHPKAGAVMSQAAAAFYFVTAALASRMPLLICLLASVGELDKRIASLMKYWRAYRRT